MSSSATVKRCLVVCLVMAGIIASGVYAQRARNRWFDNNRRGDVPNWEVDEAFADDIFTFARVRYESHGGGRGGGWATDYPSSDLNFSLRLHQLTSLKVQPQPVVLDLTDPKLFNYPFLYLIEPGRLYFYDAEVTALRRYLDNGGFLMVDDFWGQEEYANFYEQIRRVFPDREPEEVPLSHEIFHCVYDLKEKPQVPSINIAERGRSQGITW